MENGSVVRWGWLRAMYIYTLTGAGGFGLGMLAAPAAVQSLLGFPAQDPAMFKVYGCVLLASGVLAVPALVFPLKFLAVLLLQLIYKPLWIALAAVPLFLKGRFPMYIVTMTAVFLVYIVGDLIAIPWGYLFPKKETAGAAPDLAGGPSA
jgi:hypothetical protein